MYNEQTNACLIDSLLYCSVFIAPTCFNTKASSSGSSYSLPAKLHERVHAVLVVWCIYRAVITTTSVRRLYIPGRHSDNISTQTVYTVI
jgi:hypothetical protein